MLEVNSIYLYTEIESSFQQLQFKLNKSEIIQLEGENGVGKTSFVEYDIRFN